MWPNGRTSREYKFVDEPPEEVLKDVAKRRNWTERRELLGLYSGIYRTERQHFQTRIAPDLIFVFRGLNAKHPKTLHSRCPTNAVTM
jgi:predicted Zn-dependent protease with MMP-like domain